MKRQMMNRRRAIARWMVLSLVAVGLAGCGESGPKLEPVTGKVTLVDGTPVIFGHVILHPDLSRGNQSMEMSQGTIREGVYTIMTGAREGAPAGKYKVSIEAAKEVDPNNPYFTEWLADEKYVNPDKSGLLLDVVEEAAEGAYDFKLNPHPPQIKR
jgi:predicted small lipoprotein YifL